MEASAKGCEVIVTGKLRGQRAKAMKFGSGFMVKTGHASEVYTDTAVRHVLMRQGVIGIKVAIFLPQDPRGLQGPKIPLDDVVTILEPKEEVHPSVLLAQQQATAQSMAIPTGMAPAAPAMGEVPVAAVDPNVAAGF
jgi:small subunit ribosomal protein S3e